MITAEQWWRIVKAYGAQIWPAQIVFYTAAVLLTGWLFLKPGRVHSWFAKLYLSIAFAWNSIVFFLTLAKGITGNSYGNYFFGGIFGIVAILFAVDLFSGKMQFALPEIKGRRYTTLAFLLLVLCYPLLGIALGRGLKDLLVPGVIPCPTTAFSLILLTTALPHANKLAYMLLLLWAIPFPPIFQIPKYGVYEDVIMFASGIYSLILLMRHWKSETD